MDACFRKAGCAMAFAVLGTVLAGCAPLATRPAQPSQAVAATWPGDTGALPDHGEATAAELPWRTWFTDAEMQRLIGLALQNNRDLQLALLRVQEARANYGIQRADQFPTPDLGVQSTRGRTPGDLNFTGQPVVAGEYQVAVGMNSWELDLWGRVRSLKQAALQEYLATDAAGRAVRIALIAEVANAYIGLRALDERLALVDRTIETREESYRIFRRRNEVGAISTLDLTQVETLLNQARALGAQLQQARAAQAHALTLLVGTPVDLAPTAEAQLDSDDVFAPIRVGLPADLLTERPDIIAAEHRLTASHANVRAARAAFFPRIALTGSFGIASVELDGLFDRGNRAWSFVPTISLPIFDGGRRRAGLDLAEVRSNAAVADYERTIQTAFREVADALSNRLWLTQQVGIQKQSLEIQTRRARLAKLRYDSGAVTYLEVLDAQRDLLDAQQQLAQVRGDLLSSDVALYAALGGGAADDPAPHQPSVPVSIPQGHP